jgi:hypothetical protein
MSLLLKATAAITKIINSCTDGEITVTLLRGTAPGNYSGAAFVTDPVPLHSPGGNFGIQAVGCKQL